MVHDDVMETLSEWEPFTKTVQARRPDAGTWCEGWTVRDVLAAPSCGAGAQPIRRAGTARPDHGRSAGCERC
jgi:hypothetical protein